MMMMTMDEKKTEKQPLKDLKILHKRQRNENKIKRIIDVLTGEVKAGGKDTILKSNAIASCVVIAAYDPIKEIGALAHAMVPGSAPEGRAFQRTRYAANAIEEMIDIMKHMGVNQESIEVCLVGGGNVLKRKDDTICQDNITSIVELLNEKCIKIRAKAVGGTERRSISLDIEKGSVYYTQADSKEMLLWKADRRTNQ